MKYFEYQGQIITSESKKQAIQQIITGNFATLVKADLARYVVTDTCLFEYQGKKGIVTFSGVHSNFEKDVLTNGRIEVELGGKKAELYFNCDSNGDADSYSKFEGDKVCKDICKTVLLIRNKKAKKDRFRGEFIDELKDAFEYRNWKFGNKTEV